MKKKTQVKYYIKQASIYVLSLLGAIGTGLQNYVAVAALIKDLMDGAFAATKAGLSIIHSIALAFGGLCSGLVNLCVNIGLLEDFFKRFAKKSKQEREEEKLKPKLTGWRKFRYWAGSAVFVVTGLLFGLTAFAFGSIGVLAAISIAAGIFVAGIMIVQEVETWLQSFDLKKIKNPADKKAVDDENSPLIATTVVYEKPKSLKQLFIEWKKSINKRKMVGTTIAIGNVIALSLLFTLGLASFLTGVGVAALPALIIGATVAFTAGAFTEFYFYNAFLSKFCDQIKEKWKQFKATKYPAVGLVTGAINAIVNGVLSYVGIMLITGILAAASVAIPPIGVFIAIAATVSLFAAAASFILGMDFWIGNSEKLLGFFKKKKSPEPNTKVKEAGINTNQIHDKLGDSQPLAELDPLKATAKSGKIIPNKKKYQTIFEHRPIKPIATKTKAGQYFIAA